MSPSSPHLSVEDFRKQAVAIFREYFEHGDTADVAVSHPYIFHVCPRVRENMESCAFRFY